MQPKHPEMRKCIHHNRCPGWAYDSAPCCPQDTLEYLIFSHIKWLQFQIPSLLKHISLKHLYWGCQRTQIHIEARIAGHIARLSRFKGTVTFTKVHLAPIISIHLWDRGYPPSFGGWLTTGRCIYHITSEVESMSWAWTQSQYVCIDVGAGRDRDRDTKRDMEIDVETDV